MKSRTREKVLKLVKKYPDVKYSYSRLVYYYWLEYNTSALNLGEYPYLLSPESICRAYRSLVHDGYIRISKTDKIRRESLAKEVKAYFAKF